MSYGYFAFSGLRPGVYTLTEIQPDGYTDGKDRWPNGALGTTDDQFVQTLPPGTSNGPYRFGESKAFLSGYVYHDANNDGFMGGGDVGLLNVSVYLTGTRDSDGSPVTAFTRTNAFGLWQFVGLPAGVYTVSEAQPAVTRMFDGLRSRCTTRLRCAASTARATSTSRRRRWASGRWWTRA